jgi:hypothetical protein
MMETRKYTLNGVHVVEDVVPSQMVVVDEYTPSHTIAPWDYYGWKHCRPIVKRLRNKGITATICETRKTIVSPTGTGPNGSVRFGDNMLPSTYRICVNKYQAAYAKRLIVEFNQEIHNWIHHNKPMPVECQ